MNAKEREKVAATLKDVDSLNKKLKARKSQARVRDQGNRRGWRTDSSWSQRTY